MYEKIESIRIIKAEKEALTQSFIQYNIQIKSAVRQWSILRRYSEFLLLDQALKLEFSELQLPNLPSKVYFYQCISFDDEHLLQSRKVSLESYLINCLHNYGKQLIHSQTWNQFLAVPSVRYQSGIQQNSEIKLVGNGWLNALNQLETEATKIRRQLMIREKSFIEKDLYKAHQLTAQSRKDWIQYSDLLNQLYKSLELDKELTEGEKLRRNDKLQKMDMEKNILNNMIQRSGPNDLDTNSGRSSVASDRNQLLGEQLNINSNLSSPKLNNNNNNNNNNLASILPNQFKSTRKFGRNSMETSETRPLNNEQLLNLQKEKMKLQDESLLQFSNILKRQKEVGTLIGEELNTHNQLLNELDHNVDNTKLRVQGATNGVKQLG